MLVTLSVTTELVRIVFIQGVLKLIPNISVDYWTSLIEQRVNVFQDFLIVLDKCFQIQQQKKVLRKLLQVSSQLEQFIY